jgi:hypothetical protein
LAAPTPASSKGGSALADLAWLSSRSAGLSERRSTAKGVTAVPGLPLGNVAPSRAPGAAFSGRRPMARRPMCARFSVVSGGMAASAPGSPSTPRTPSSDGSSGQVSPVSLRGEPFRDDRATPTKIAGQTCRPRPSKAGGQHGRSGAHQLVLVGRDMSNASPASSEPLIRGKGRDGRPPSWPDRSARPLADGPLRPDGRPVRG